MYGLQGRLLPPCRRPRSPHEPSVCQYSTSPSSRWNTLHASMDYATFWGTYLYQYSAVQRRNIAVYTIPNFIRPKPEPVAEIPQPCETCRPRTATSSSKPLWPPTYQLGFGSANYRIILVRSRGLTTLPRTMDKHPDVRTLCARKSGSSRAVKDPTKCPTEHPRYLRQVRTFCVAAHCRVVLLFRSLSAVSWLRSMAQVEGTDSARAPL